MTKPIVATTLSGLFIKREPWEVAHILWYEKAAEELNDESVKEWAHRENYFEGVDKIMKRLYPKLSEEKRTVKARETFFDSVCEYVARNPQLVNSQVAEYFRSIKNKYRIALITTNTKRAIDKILSSAGLEDIFDIIESSKLEEKDDKFAVFDRFVEKHGKPLIYIGGGRKDSFDYCDIMKIKCIFANFERDDEIPNVKSAHGLNELKAILERA